MNAEADGFVLRTALLPFDEVIAWAEGVCACAAAGNADSSDALEQAWERDRATLRERLRATYQRAEVREALYVASPGLAERATEWFAGASDEAGIERALARYFLRMAGRATPFGLFAGCSVGRTAADTTLVLAERTAYRRRSRLDMDYLSQLAEALQRDDVHRPRLRYVVNSSLYRAGGRLRYAECRVGEAGRHYHLVAVDETPYLNRALERAASGATPLDIANAIVESDPDIALEDASGFVDQLIDTQLLVSELAPPVTGRDAIDVVIDTLCARVPDSVPARVLTDVRTGLSTLDAGPLGAPPDRYRSVAESLAALPVEVDPKKLVQVDLMKPAPNATLGEAVLREVRKGADVLNRLSDTNGEGPELERFVEGFRERYEDREVPLVEVLDEEVGIGFGFARSPRGGGEPLLAGLGFPPPEPEERVRWNARHAFLARRLAGVFEEGRTELELTEEDVASFETDPPAMPNAWSATVSIAARSPSALLSGDFRVYVNSVGGPSGARMLGRFCHLDSEFETLVTSHVKREQAHDPDAVFAEIVHLPEGRHGNILFRPVLRDAEIPFLGRSGSDETIPIEDLLVSVVGKRVRLRSRRLDREVIPRLTAAHRYVGGRIGLYQFLCTLQSQGVMAGMQWSWGPLAFAPRLPRVTMGRLVLARATWRLDEADIRSLAVESAPTSFRRVQKLRPERLMPRIVEIVDGDNTLPIDLDNATCVDVLVDLTKKRSSVTLREMFPAPEDLPVTGPEGAFVHEIIVPFVTPTPKRRQRLRRERRRDTLTRGDAPAVRTFTPGSEWLYAKLYTGTATADRVLKSVVRPVVTDALRSGATDGWFFIRYADPKWHLRVRFRGQPARLLGDVLPNLHDRAEFARNAGELWRIQLDTYEREVERYGGEGLIEPSETLFHADSDAVLSMLEVLGGDSGAEDRWRVTLVGVDRLLADLGLDVAERLRVVEGLRLGLASEFRIGSPFDRQLSLKHRNERPKLARLMEGKGLPAAIADALGGRSDASREAVARIRDTADAREDVTLVHRMATSLVHMHTNRMFRSTARAQEMVIYDFLMREYRSALARARKKPDSGHHAGAKSVVGVGGDGQVGLGEEKS